MVAVAATIFYYPYPPQIPKKRLSLSDTPSNRYFARDLYVLRIRFTYTFGVGLNSGWDQVVLLIYTYNVYVKQVRLVLQVELDLYIRIRFMYTLNVYEYGVRFALRETKLLFIYTLYVYVIRICLGCAFRATRKEVRLGSYLRILYTYTLNVEVPGA